MRWHIYWMEVITDTIGMSERTVFRLLHDFRHRRDAFWQAGDD